MDFLKYGLPLIISFISISVFVRIERFVIQYTAGAEDLGRYSAAFTLSNLAISSFFTILTLPTYPVIMRLLNEGNMQEARSIYKRNGQLILIIGLVAVSLCFLLNQPLCQLFFGPDKGEQISGLFPWVVVSTFLFNYRVHYSEQLFQFNKETKKAMYLGLIIGGAHFVIGYLLSNAFGARGVSYSGILTNSLLIAYIIYYSRTVLAKKPMAFT
jgi:O-antigen/teichoic acid export membrane protein